MGKIEYKFTVHGSQAKEEAMKKILIIDDDQAIAEALQIMLESENYTVSAMSKIDGLIEKIILFQPDIILLDLLLKGTDGRSVANKLKNHPQAKNIPIVMLSAYPNIEEKAKESGADGFLAKPFDIDKLLATVKIYSARR